jgi:hypothetical protein
MTKNRTDQNLKFKTSHSFWHYFAFVNFIFGTKLWLIDRFGNATPFMDQWDAEALLLYKSFIDGTLKFAFLFSPHNEHRIFTTRLLALSELILNGIWNPLLQMVVNAGLHIIVLVILIALTTRVVGRIYLPALLAFSALLFILPYGYENTLTGFQAQFYFVLLFSIVGLWLTTLHEPFSFSWNCGLVCSLLAFFSFSSGAFSIAASVAVGFIFYLLKLRKNNKQLFAILTMGILFIACVALTPLNENQNGKANSITQFIKSLFEILFWPSPNELLGILQNAPAIIFCVLMFRRKPAAKDPKWFLTSLIIWMFAVSSGIAYARTMSPLSSRYLDLFIISILINFFCLLLIFDEHKIKWKKVSFFCLFIWVLSVGVSLQIYNACFSQKGLRSYSETKIDQEKNTKNYVKTGNINNLINETIPYPDPRRLAMILDMPEVRSILPSNIAPPDRPIKDGRFDKWVTVLIRNYYVFIVIGLLSAIVCGLISFFASAKKSEKIPV